MRATFSQKLDLSTLKPIVLALALAASSAQAFQSNPSPNEPAVQRIVELLRERPEMRAWAEKTYMLLAKVDATHHHSTKFSVHLDLPVYVNNFDFAARMDSLVDSIERGLPSDLSPELRTLAEAAITRANGQSDADIAIWADALVESVHQS